MLNGDGNENGQKIKWSNKQKQKTSLHVTAHFFVNFFAVVVATWNFQVTRTMEKMSLCLQKILLFVFLFAFFISLPLIFTLKAASISHLLTAGIKFSCCSSNEIRLLFVFYLSL